MISIEGGLVTATNACRPTDSVEGGSTLPVNGSRTVSGFRAVEPRAPSPLQRRLLRVGAVAASRQGNSAVEEALAVTPVVSALRPCAQSARAARSTTGSATLSVATSARKTASVRIDQSTPTASEQRLKFRRRPPFYRPRRGIGNATSASPFLAKAGAVVGRARRLDKALTLWTSAISPSRVLTELLPLPLIPAETHHGHRPHRANQHFEQSWHCEPRRERWFFSRWNRRQERGWTHSGPGGNCADNWGDRRADQPAITWTGSFRCSTCRRNQSGNRRRALPDRRSASGCQYDSDRTPSRLIALPSAFSVTSNVGTTRQQLSRQPRECGASA